MADRLRTVKSAAGDYSTLAAWEAGEEADLVTLDERRIAECYAFEDTTPVIIAGWTEDATRYAKITVAAGERHAGVWSTSAYRLTISNNTGILFGEPFTRAEYIQLQMSESGATGRTGFLIGATGAGLIYFDSCIFRQNPASAGSGSLNGYANSGGADTVIRNSLFYDFRQGTGRGVSNNPGITHLYNCTAHNCDEGFRRGSGTVIARNCLANDCTDGFVGTFDATSNYNASDIAADAPGANSRNGASGTATFANEAGDDFHLGAGDTNCKDQGENLSAITHGFSTDIDGATRTGSWDIGMDEITAGGGGTAYFQTITASMPGVVALTPRAQRRRTLAAGPVGVPTLAARLSMHRTLSASTTAAPTLQALRRIRRTLTVTMPGLATLARKVVAHRVLSAAAMASPSLAAGARMFSQTLDASMTAVSSLARGLVLHALLAAIVLGAVSMATRATFRRTLAAAGSWAVSLARPLTARRNLSVTLEAIPVLARRLAAHRTLSATATSAPTLSTGRRFTQALTATFSAVVSLVAAFISGSDVGETIRKDLPYTSTVRKTNAYQSTVRKTGTFTRTVRFTGPYDE